MYVDALLALSGSILGNTVTGQAVGSVGTIVLSTNTIDLASGGVPASQIRDLGEGQDLFGRFEVVVAVAGGTSIDMQVIATDAANLTGNVTVIGSTGAIPIAQLVAGARFACQINPRLASRGQRYIGCQYVSVGTTTAITVYGDIGVEIQDGMKFYQNGFAVL